MYTCRPIYRMLAVELDAEIQHIRKQLDSLEEEKKAEWEPDAVIKRREARVRNYKARLTEARKLLAEQRRREALSWTKQ